MKKYCLLLLFATATAVFGGEVRLQDLSYESTQQGWGSLQIDKAVGGQPLSIAGKTFQHGLGTHAASEVVYELAGEYAGQFEAWVGVDDAMRGYTNSSVVFQVFGDGNKLFDSGVMRLNDPAKRVSVAIASVEELKLIVTDAGDGNSCDHADWAEPVLSGARTEVALPAKYSLEVPGLTIRLDANGGIAGSSVGGVTGQTRLRGCRQAGDVAVKGLSGGSYAFTRQLTDSKNHSVTVIDRFAPTKDSIRWEVEITSPGKPWSTAIETRLKYPATADSRFWTAWGNPEPARGTAIWADPMLPAAFAARKLNYQFPRILEFWGNDQFQANVFSMPLCSILEPSSDTALSVILSPEDTLLDMTLRESADGTVIFSRTKHRLGEVKTRRFAMDLTAHPADPRAALGWMVARYPLFFNPGHPKADELSGHGAYSGCETPINAEKFRKMAFGFNWKLSDDFPYMGNFIPVTGMDDQWTRSCDEPAPHGKGREISCRQMNDYAKWMKDNGFHVLSYFNVTEYGKAMPWPIPARKAKADTDIWKDPADFFYHGGLASGVLMDGGKPLYSNCYGALIVDPGDPAYQKHILEQVRRNTELLPNTDGICIDRTDWMTEYNPNADDGASWVDGKPARSLFLSWQDLMDKMCPMLHRSGKVVFGNTCVPRLEVMGRLDGFYCENTLPPFQNFSALLGIRKPTSVWTFEVPSDGEMQRFLYLGIFTTAPYPYNNHCLGSFSEADTQYLAYGPLFNAIRGKKWVLAPHCVESDSAKVNLFEVPGGYALPVSFAGKAESVTVRVRNIPGLDKMKCEALHPGTEKPVTLAGRFKDGVLELSVPVVRGCAMVRIAPQLPREVERS